MELKYYALLCTSKYFLQMKISRPTLSLLLLTAVCGILFVTRFIFTRELLSFALFWNIFLAWVPLFLALISRRLWQTNFQKLAYFNLGLWLLFFPNSPYIVTDLIHLDHLAHHLWWFDSLGIFTAALLGISLGIYSLHIVHQLLRTRFSNYVSWLLVFGSTFLCSFGIYLGRFSRLNSWDLFTRPRFTLAHSLHQMFNPQAIQITLVFSLVLTVFYIAFNNLIFNANENS